MGIEPAGRRGTPGFVEGRQRLVFKGQIVNFRATSLLELLRSGIDQGRVFAEYGVYAHEEQDDFEVLLRRVLSQQNFRFASELERQLRGVCILFGAAPPLRVSSGQTDPLGRQFYLRVLLQQELSRLFALFEPETRRAFGRLARQLRVNEEDWRTTLAGARYVTAVGWHYVSGGHEAVLPTVLEDMNGIDLFAVDREGNMHVLQVKGNVNFPPGVQICEPGILPLGDYGEAFGPEFYNIGPRLIGQAAAVSAEYGLPCVPRIALVGRGM